MPNTSSAFIIQNAILSAKLARKAGNRLSVHGISLTEYLVMDYLCQCPQEVSRIELAEYLGMSASGVTRLLLPMEKNGVVEKVQNPRDARQSLVRLSKTGKSLYQDASVSFTHIAEELTSGLSETQLSKAVELLVKLG
ncbi:MarR family winged helix-turn-helix transcriptional regulator [Microbulbifer pacificus]|uniref:MarR family transcriptional regulator n=1 Tax=Microbulbifer pacificus TaxID=407164 RepID=A0AAU0MWC2_9GAMM|nr:MarR family transcriptional regulator [Microbulbifer pacificus]WOX04317.1 MarR family transcriptional regulator [Microbulbifer pacificus]